MPRSSARRPRESRFTRFAAAAAAAAAIAAGGPARAQDTAAEGIFDEGLKLFDAGNYAAACPKLKSAVKLSTSEPLGGKLLLAECYEKQGKWASAWALYREVIAKAALASQETRREKAAAGQARVEPKLPRLQIQLAPQVASLAGLAIDRDGEPVPPEARDVALPVDPGPNVVTVSAPGKIPFKATVQVEDAPKTTSVKVERLDDDPQAAPGAAPPKSGPPHDDPPAPPPRADDEGGLGGLGITGIALGGVGVVGIGVSAIVAVSAKSSWDTAVADRDDAGVDDARGTGDAATGVFIAGAVLTAVGATLLVVDLASGSPSPGAGATLRVRTAGAGLSAEGAF